MLENDLSLHYTVSEKDYFKEQNSQNYDQIKKMLEDVGVFFSVEEDRLCLFISTETYNNVKKRNAGRHKNVFRGENQKNYIHYTYADIVFMLQSMTDKEICEKTGIPQATFYRHKKLLKESRYYKSLDTNRLGDKEYLQSVDGNFAF